MNVTTALMMTSAMSLLVAAAARGQAEDNDLGERLCFEVKAPEDRVLLDHDGTKVTALQPPRHRRYTVKANGVTVNEFAEQLKDFARLHTILRAGEIKFTLDEKDVSHWELLAAIAKSAGLYVYEFNDLSTDPDDLDVTSVQYFIHGAYLLALRPPIDSKKEKGHAQLVVMANLAEASDSEDPQPELEGVRADGTVKKLTLQKFHGAFGYLYWMITDEVSEFVEVRGTIRLYPFRELIRVHTRAGAEFTAGGLRFKVNSFDEVTQKTGNQELSAAGMAISLEDSALLLTVCHEPPKQEGLTGEVEEMDFQMLGKKGKEPIYRARGWGYDGKCGTISVGQVDAERWDGGIMVELGIIEEQVAEVRFDMKKFREQ